MGDSESDEVFGVSSAPTSINQHQSSFNSQKKLQTHAVINVQNLNGLSENDKVVCAVMRHNALWVKLNVICSFCFSINVIMLFNDPLMRFGRVACLSSVSNLEPAAKNVAI